MITSPERKNSIPRDSEFFLALANFRNEIPAESEELRRLVFYGLEEKIANALEAYDKNNLETFALRRDNVIISLDSVAKLFRSLDEESLNKWKELYSRAIDAFEAGSAAYKTATFSHDPERRFYEVMHWAQTQLRQNMRFRYYQKAESTLEPSEIISSGVRRIAKDLREPSFGKMPESERENWYVEKAKEVYRGVAAFVVADTLQT